jgi:glutathione S-transferase
MFESRAGLLHLARTSEKLVPRDSAGDAETLQSAIAAINSIEMGDRSLVVFEGPRGRGLSVWMEKRLAQLEAVLNRRDGLVSERLTLAD